MHSPGAVTCATSQGCTGTRPWCPWRAVADPTRLLTCIAWRAQVDCVSHLWHANLDGSGMSGFGSPRR
eukprot:6030985-Pyramimonas_sp.AAC.2